MYYYFCFININVHASVFTISKVTMPILQICR